MHVCMSPSVSVCVYYVYLRSGPLFAWANVAEILFKWIQAEILVNFYGKYVKLTEKAATFSDACKCFVWYLYWQA